MGRAQGKWRAAALAVAVVVSSAALSPPVVAAPLPAEPAAQPAADGSAQPLAQHGWKLRWAPSARHDGLRAFEHVEEDRAGSHPEGQPHIRVQDNSYRFDMHMVDRDSLPDRQRQEVRGARGLFGSTVSMLEGETWRFTYSMFIPAELKATRTFNHIMQLKNPGTGSNPILTMSLRRHGDVPKIELKVLEGNVLVGAVDLAPLQNRWIDVELEMKLGDAPHGTLRWVLRDGVKTVIDTTATGVDTWLPDRVRPKWGIYRSLKDTSGSLEDAYMLIAKLRAYQWSDRVIPPVSLRYEAERAKIHRGTVASEHDGHSGSGYVDYADEAGGYVEWKAYALYPSRATLHLWYSNATTLGRPMDITVNGVLVAQNLAFDRTPAWNDWETRTLIIPLRAGANTIRATATSANGGPNLDSVEVQHAVP